MSERLEFPTEKLVSGGRENPGECHWIPKVSFLAVSLVLGRDVQAACASPLGKARALPVSTTTLDGSLLGYGGGVLRLSGERKLPSGERKLPHGPGCETI